MSRIPTIIFPEFYNQVSREGLQQCLDLVESIVGFSKGKSLTRVNIDLITKKLGSRMSGTRLFPGGTSVLFAWSFYFNNLGSIIIKPYYTREIVSLLIHYFTLQDFDQYLDDFELEFQSMQMKIDIPKVIGIAKIRSMERDYPVLMTFEAVGEPIQKNAGIIGITSKIARNLGKKGIIMDPYPANWKFSVKNGHIIIEYIDLLSSNLLKDLKNRITELLNRFE